MADGILMYTVFPPIDRVIGDQHDLHGTRNDALESKLD